MILRMFFALQVSGYADGCRYYHVPFTHCPTTEKDRLKLKCSCNPKDNFDWKGTLLIPLAFELLTNCTGYSCTARHFDIMGLEKPEGYENQMD